ncbi:MAG: M23 family metallopeptidase [Pseudomonadota bacterium]
MLLVAIIVQNAIVLAMLAAIFFAPAMPRQQAIYFIIAATAVLLGFLLAGVWVYPPTAGGFLYILLLAGASIRFYRRSLIVNKRPDPKNAVLALFLVGFASVLIWQGIGGRISPDTAHVDLAAPLPEGDRYCALSAGASTALNLHFAEGSSTGASFEKHSVDFVRHNALGFRTVLETSWHPKPRDPARYAVFGAPVFAPCTGKVLQSENEKPDLPAGHRYRSSSGANLVVLQCKNIEVVMAHLKRGSVQVEEGVTVSVGQMLGRVGNSGNTEEPHLHINAQRSLPDGRKVPVPMRFGGRYLVRGDCL